jgi:EAL domain-containing protein (putative c-di-GMP-specific phosphodiesterase class I)
VGDADAVISRLRALKEIGLRVAVDDFGTGYSSLAYLKRFPIDVLKIDRSFVSGVGDAHEDSAILSAIVNWLIPWEWTWSPRESKPRSRSQP